MNEINNPERQIDKPSAERSPEDMRSAEAYKGQNKKDLDSSFSVDLNSDPERKVNSNSSESQSNRCKESLEKAQTFTESFRYEHDPRDNPKAMKDIVQDDKAVYGFKPSKEGSIKQYANFDWSNPDVVANAQEPNGDIFVLL